jgi:hypothetical protein
MLGIFIGVAAVIAMVAVGNGARYSVQQQIQSLGTNLLVILPGATTSSGVRAGAGSTSTLARRRRGRRSAKQVERRGRRQLHGSAGRAGGSRQPQLEHQYRGHHAIAYLEIRDWAVVSGRPFTDDETRSAAPVCLLGADRRQQSFCARPRSDRRDYPGQEFPAAGGRRAGCQGPIQLWPGPGRRRS